MERNRETVAPIVFHLTTQEREWLHIAVSRFVVSEQYAIALEICKQRGEVPEDLGQLKGLRHLSALYREVATALGIDDSAHK